MQQQLTREELLRYKWYSEDTKERDVPRILFSLMHFLDGHQRQYRDEDWVHWRLFDNDTALRAMGRRAPRRRLDLRLTLNVVRACVNTVHSKIVQSKPRPTYLTVGQGHRARQSAKKTQAYTDGLMYHGKTYEVMSDAVRLALIFGTAGVHTTQGADGMPESEALPNRVLKVEHADGKNRKPRNMYIHRPVDRDDLLERFKDDPEAVELIKSATAAPPSEHLYEGEIADQVMVVEAYRRPRARGGDGGKHIIALENGILVSEDWTRDIPIRILRWGVRPEGFWGYGIAEQLKELQVEINWTLLTATEQMRLAGPKIFVNRGSAINEDEISNEIWGIIEYTGDPPTYMMFQSVDPALFQHLDRLYARSFDEVGVSQMSAQGEKPPGLNSGKALMTFSDIETAKFVSFGQHVETLVKEVSDDLLDTAINDDDEDSASNTVVAPIKDKYRRRYVQKVKKSDVAASRDDMICQVFPTSALAQQPAQKMQQVGDMQDKGWLDPMEAMQLLDFPDLDNATALATSPLEYIDMCIDRMLEDGVVMHPEPWINFQMAQQRVSHALLRAQIDEVPEERWQILAAYAKACGDAIKSAAAANAPPPTRAGAAPPAAAPPPALPAAA